MEFVESRIEQILTNAGFMAEAVPYLRLLFLVLVLATVAGICFFITKKLIVANIYKLFKRSSFTWDDVLADHQIFRNLAHIAPAFVVRALMPLLLKDFDSLLPIAMKMTDAYLVVVGTMVVLSFLKVAEYGLSKSAVFIDKPLASYFQLFRIVLYIASGILVLSVLLGRSPVFFLSAFGAMTAILLLIFKDTILGLVASVQMSSSDMVRVGDWIEMPKFNADGDVIAINLNTVKVRNWDKTVTTIPTYYFVTDSFKNWRGMQESGGRRIKRSFFINVRTVKFIDPETREHYKNYHLLTDYLTRRQHEIEAHTAAPNFNTAELINGRRMTNIGVFRHYIGYYLKNHPGIKQDMTLLVRQLAMADHGVPLEIYCFTNTVKWAEYEEIQSDIFDHLLAAASFFDLEIFQQPGGSDITNALRQISHTPEAKLTAKTANKNLALN